MCNGISTDVHHIRHHAFGAGMGIKPDDLFIIPVCRTCHQTIEADPANYRRQSLVWVLTTLAKAIKDGYFNHRP